MDRDLLKEVSELFILKVSYGFGQVSVVYDRCVQVIVSASSICSCLFIVHAQSTRGARKALIDFHRICNSTARSTDISG
jgi:hypothetical protein